MQQSAERLSADRAFADMLMPVQLRPKRSLRVVAVPYHNRVKADSLADQKHRFDVAVWRDDVVARDVDVAGIQANADRRARLQTLDQLGNLLELRAQRELRAGGVLNEDLERLALPGDAVDGPLNRLRSQAQAFIAGQSLPASRMKNEVLSAERERALHLAAKCRNGVGADGLGLAA